MGVGTNPTLHEMKRPTIEHMKNWGVFALFWLAVLVTTHDMAQASSCVSPTSASFVDVVVSFLGKVKLWQ